MKKVAISVLVIGGFVFYGWYQRQTKPDVAAVAPKKSVDEDTSPTISVANMSASGPSPTVAPLQSTSSSTGLKDGQYTGNESQNIYGTIQVKAIIQNGKLADVQFLQYPNDRQESVEINTQAMPILTQEAIKAQNTNVDIVSGATDSSQSFKESLRSALDQAKS
jgi:uncharacterized protein with FMN-binding domain